MDLKPNTKNGWVLSDPFSYMNNLIRNYISKNKDGWKEVLLLAWPLIIANGFWIIQTTVDRIFLSQYSTNSLAAATAVSGLFWAPMALVQHTAAYSMTFTAQYFGARKFDMVGTSIWQAFYISVLGGLAFLLLIPLAPFLFNLLGHSDDILNLEITYFQALCFSAIPFSILGSLGGFFAGIGKSQYVIPMNLVGVVSNIIFNYMFIFGNWGVPEYGIQGAGYTTALSALTACCVGFYLMFNKKHEDLYKVWSKRKPNFDLLKRYVRYGLPSGLQYALEGLAFSVFLIFMGRLPNGNVALASSGIVISILMLAIMPVVGVAQAASVLVGQYIGRDLPQKAEFITHNSFQVAILYILTMSLSFVFFPDFYLGWFANNSDPSVWNEVVRISPILLIFTAIFIPFDCMNVIYAFALKGAGDTKFVTLAALTIPWPTMVVPTYLILNRNDAVYWGWAFTTIFLMLQGLCFFFRFKGGKWKKMKVI